MKTILKYSSLLAMAALACAACENDVVEFDDYPSDAKDGGYRYSFAVSDAEELTRATVYADSFLYENGDALGLYVVTSEGNTLNAPCSLAVSDESSTLSMASNFPIKAGDKVYAYFPYSEQTSRKPSEVVLTIPAAQKQLATAFDASAMPAVAVPYVAESEPQADSDGTITGNLQMVRLASLVEFNIWSSDESIRDEYVKAVTFTASSPIAGSFTFDITSESAGEMKISGHDKTAVTTSVSEADADGMEIGASEATGVKVMMAVAPGSYTGTIDVITDAMAYSVVLDESVDFGRNKLVSIDIDLGEAGQNTDLGIHTAAELMAFASAAASGNYAQWEQNGEVMIMEDIDLAGYDWTPVASFAGVLNGNGKTISNMRVSTSSETNVAMFATLEGTVKNLTLDGTCSFAYTGSSAANVAAFAATATEGAVISDCVNRATVSGGKTMGGIAGTATLCTVTSCENYGSVTYGGSIDGNIVISGIVGNATSVQLTDCANYGDITNTGSCGGSTTKVAGVLANISDMTLKNCRNYGKVYSESSSTGRIVVAGVAADSWRSSFESCRNAGGVTLISTAAANGNNRSVGGIVSYMNEEKTSVWNVLDCHNTGAVLLDSTGDAKALMNAGGVIGTVWQVIGQVTERCTNSGSVTSRVNGYKQTTDVNYFNGTGGVIGFMRVISENEKSYFKVNECVNYGIITVNNPTLSVTHLHNVAGGIVGESSWANLITSCRNEGDIYVYQTMSVIAGGIIGLSSGDVRDCVNIAKVYNTGHTSYWSELGGIVGRSVKASTVSGCKNTGMIMYGNGRGAGAEKDIRLGGIQGSVYSKDITIDGCRSHGTILYGNVGCAGTVVGRAHTAKATVKGCTVGTSIGVFNAGAADFGASDATVVTASDLRLSGASDNFTDGGNNVLGIE